MTVQPPFKYDVVGSFLRPERLKEARKNYEKKLDFKLLQMENSEEDIGI